MIGVQAEGAAPLARAFERRIEELEPFDSPQTYATAIRIGRPVSWRDPLWGAREAKDRHGTVALRGAPRKAGGRRPRGAGGGRR
ncbi:MAG: hypothetical protein RXS42_08115 [Nitrososphaeria archaeon]